MSQSPIQQIQEKLENLKGILRDMESVVIGYSGGVDSTFLASVGARVLGSRALAVAAVSETYPRWEREEAERFAQDLGLSFVFVSTGELDDPLFTANPPERCYFCKKELIAKLKTIAKERGIAAVAFGTNTDDLADFRPGQRAAKEEGVRSPLLEAGLSKSDIRGLSREMGIPTWNKPSFACLASRIPYGTRITREALRMIESAEELLRGMGIRQFRVRHHGDSARIEVLPEEMEKVLARRVEITEGFRGIGYTYTSLDLSGYRMGAMNEALTVPDTSRVSS
jgi:uncharacterized protein